MDGDLANARADRRSGISDTDSARSWHSDNGCRWRSDSRLSCWSTAPTLHRVRPGGHCGPPGCLSFLHEYQQKRVLIFLDPESDPLGAGYHISQSKIAIGSGGIFGKGFLNRSEEHT